MIVATSASCTSDEGQNDAEDSSTALTAALDRLAVLLQDSDADAADLLDEIAQQAQGTSLAAGLKPVSRAVESFDFDAALSALKAIWPSRE